MPRRSKAARKNSPPAGMHVEALEARIAPATLFGLDQFNNIVRFDSATPGTTDAPIPITGLAAGEVLHGIDFRPATGQLYALGVVEGAGTDDATGRIYTINTLTGAATQVGAAPFSTTLADDAHYGFDFNPTVDRIRIVNSADQNLRVNPDTGALAGTDTALNNAAASEEIVGAAYDRSGGGLASTTLFGIDFANNTLVRQGGVDGNPSPNLGGITTIGPLGVFLGTPDGGFDIAPGTDTAYAALTTQGVTGPHSLYTINLTTGAATLVGEVGTGSTFLRGLAAATTALVVAGTAGPDSLVVTATGPASGSYTINGGAPVAFSGITAFTFDGGAGADTLTINNPAGSLFAPSGGISFNGQDPTTAPDDALVLAGGGGASFSETYFLGASAGFGSVVTMGGTLTQTIIFNGIEPITDTVTVGSFDINLTAAVNTVHITSGPIIGTNQTTVVGDGAGGTYEDVTFANKGAVRVSGLGGADLFTVDQTATGTGLTSLTLFGHDVTGSGDDNAGDTFIITATTSPTSVNAGGGNDTILFETGATLSGGTLDGGAGTDTVDYSAYTTPIAVNLGSAPGTLNATLSPAQEVPPNATGAGGTATLTYNIAAKTFNVTLEVTGISPADVTGFHIHNAAFGVNGSIIVDFAPGGTPIAPLVPTANGFTFTATNVALPALNEAAFVGGVTYVNIHTTPSFTGGQIRGQIFPAAAFVAGAGTATGTAGINGIENVISGSGADSLVGNLSANQLLGGEGNDTIVGSGGSDTLVGGENDDHFAWSNGDGTDTIDGGDGGDTMQVNGAASGDDVFSIGAGSVGRIDFDRTSPGPFSLNIGTVESLIVNGLGGNDTFTIGQQPAMPNPLAVSLNGQDGNDTFNLTSPVGPTSGAPLSVSINGGSAAGSLGNDVVNMEAPANRSPVFTYQAIATGGVMVSGFMPTAVNITATERVSLRRKWK
jgi:hypothetical protein